MRGVDVQMVTATAGLQEGKITPSTMLACPSYMSYNGWVYHNWASYNLGYMNVAKALAVSCDTFFYQVAAMVGDVTLARYARAFGFGQAKGIEMPGVAPGLVPDRIWKQLQCSATDVGTDACRWTLATRSPSASGNRRFSRRRLNQAIYVAALANGRHGAGTDAGPPGAGRIRSRHLDSAAPGGRQGARVHSQPDAGSRGYAPGDQPSVQHELLVPSAGVPADGGGKTGTAQWGGSGLNLPTHAWFVFFAPYAQPDIAMSIFVERGELSEVEAAPIGVQIMKFYNGGRAAVHASAPDPPA